MSGRSVHDECRHRWRRRDIHSVQFEVTNGYRLHGRDQEVHRPSLGACHNGIGSEALYAALAA